VILFARSVDIRVSLTKFASNFLLFRPKCCLQTSQAARLSSIDYVQLCVLMNVAFRFFSPLLEANRRPREWLSLLQGVSSDDGGARRLDLSTQLLRHFTDPSAGACRHDEKKEAPVKVGNPVFGNGWLMQLRCVRKRHIGQIRCRTLRFTFRIGCMRQCRGCALCSPLGCAIFSIAASVSSRKISRSALSEVASRAVRFFIMNESSIGNYSSM